jgi:putative transposase
VGNQYRPKDAIAFARVRQDRLHRTRKPLENGYCESFNSKLRHELLNGEIFYTLKEAKIVIENWRRHYNTVRPHSSRGYRPPAPEAFVWPPPKPVAQTESLN